jgi:hypothetical protein
VKQQSFAAGMAAGIAALSVIGTTGIAQASENNAYISRPTGVHSAPSLQSPTRFTLRAGTHVRAVCYVPDGQEVHDNTFWFRIVSEERGGFVPKHVIAGVPRDLPHC